MAEWFTSTGETEEETAAAQDRLITEWPDAPLDRPETCEFILSTARIQVLAFAPAATDGAVVEDGYVVPTPTVIPDNWVLGQLMQAQNLWNAGRVSSDGNLGDGGFVFTPRPLDRTIRDVIRPPDRKPHVL